MNDYMSKYFYNLHSVIQSFSHSINQSFIHSFIHSAIHSFIANLAQLVEQLIRNEQVAGSIPAVGSGKIGLSGFHFQLNSSMIKSNNFSCTCK